MDSCSYVKNLGNNVPNKSACLIQLTAVLCIYDISILNNYRLTAVNNNGADQTVIVHSFIGIFVVPIPAELSLTADSQSWTPVFGAGTTIFEAQGYVYMLLYGGAPTFWQRGLWDSGFQNSSESSDQYNKDKAVYLNHT